VQIVCALVGTNLAIPINCGENMAKIEGKRGTVTYEVITTNTDTERLLSEVISNALKAIVNKDDNKLKEMLSTENEAQVKTRLKSSGVKYSKEFMENPELIPLGGKWAFAVGITTDESGEKAVRISKGKIKGGFYRDKIANKMVLTPDDPKDPISQVSRINIKSFENWSNLQEPVIKRLRFIEENVK
jgi:hypothetical protein